MLFTIVMDELTLGLDEEDEEYVPTDRSYWEQKVGRDILGMADRLLEMIKSFAPEMELKYIKSFIRLAKDGQADHFVHFKPRKSFLTLSARLDQSEALEREIEDAGLDLMGYSKWKRYRVRLRPQDIETHQPLLTKLMQMAYEGGES